MFRFNLVHNISSPQLNCGLMTDCLVHLIEDAEKQHGCNKTNKIPCFRFICHAKNRFSQTRLMPAWIIKPYTLYLVVFQLANSQWSPFSGKYLYFYFSIELCTPVTCPVLHCNFKSYYRFYPPANIAVLVCSLICPLLVITSNGH